MADRLQSKRHQNLRQRQKPRGMASDLHDSDQSGGGQPEHHGELLPRCLISDRTRLAHGTSSEFDQFLGRSLLQIHRQLPGTFTKPGVEWDLYQIAQKKNETLRDYIRRFMKKKNTIPGASDPVVMASFRTGIRDPDLLKKLARRAQAPESVKELFDMADRYASQEEAMAAENNDRPRQNQRKDNAESSKSKGQKRKGD